MNPHQQAHSDYSYQNNNNSDVSFNLPINPLELNPNIRGNSEFFTLEKEKMNPSFDSNSLNFLTHHHLNEPNDTENFLSGSSTYSKISDFSNNIFRKKKKQYFKKYLREKAIKKLKESFKKLKCKKIFNTFLLNNFF